MGNQNSESVTVREAISVLNNILKLDAPMVSKLFFSRMTISTEPAIADRLISARRTEDNQLTIGVIAIINALFGLNNGIGKIAAIVEDGEIVSFIETPIARPNSF